MLRAINELIDACHKAHRPIIYIGNEFPRTQFVSNLFRNHAAVKGTPGTMLDERLHVVNDVYFAKRTGSALTNPDLVAYLAENLITRITIVGVFAEGCVLATAKDALKRRFHVTGLEDAVAGANDRKRDAALGKMKQLGANVMTTERYLQDHTLSPA